MSLAAEPLPPMGLAWTGRPNVAVDVSPRYNQPYSGGLAGGHSARQADRAGGRLQPAFRQLLPDSTRQKG
jgi:hypothetical protein